LDRKRPASFSRRVDAGLLRQQWQQSGILVTDAFLHGRRL
jgi:beta-glucosidase-like glycosyl hydrolase